MDKIIDVLGTQYLVRESNEGRYKQLIDVDGFCDTSTKICIVDDMEKAKEDPHAKKDMDEYKKKVKRHEIIHAFLYESGLSCESWGENEEIVDWMAIQIPKIVKAFKHANCI